MTKAILSADQLKRNWGFGDGDMLDELIYDFDTKISPKDVLVEAVKKFLLPALKKPVEVDIYITHNPIRLADGFDIDGSEDVAVEVDEAEILAIARELRDAASTNNDSSTSAGAIRK